MGKRGKTSRCLGVPCVNRDCILYGEISKGNIVSNGTYLTKNERRQKFICRQCGKVFSERTDRFLFNLRTPVATVLMAFELLLSGMCKQGVARVLRLKPDTLRFWLRRATEHSEEVGNLLRREQQMTKPELSRFWVLAKRPPVEDWVDEWAALLRSKL